MKNEGLQIHCFNQLSATRNDRLDLIGGQYRLRYEVLNTLGWGVFFEDTLKIEYDEYDSPTTQYFAYYDHTSAKITACARLCRTDISYPQRAGTLTYMLNDHFAHAVEGGLEKYANLRFREGSRLCVSRSHSSEDRAVIVAALLIGMMKYCLDNAIDGLLGIMPPKVTRSTWGRLGLRPLILGPEVHFANNNSAQARLNMVSSRLYERAVSGTGRAEPQLVFGESDHAP